MKMKAFTTLFRTEAKLAIRGGDMVLFGILFPVGIMLLIGFISAPTAIAPAFAGVASVGICAAGLMGLPLTIASYRHEKILKRFKVTPVSPLVLLLADIAIQTIVAWVSALAVYLIARCVFGLHIVASPIRYMGTFLFVQFSVYGIGFLIASLAPNIKTANIVCTVVYFPTLFLSGATVPYRILPRGVQVFAEIFPLTQGIKLLEGVVTGTGAGTNTGSILVLVCVAIVSYLISLRFFRWE